MSEMNYEHLNTILAAIEAGKEVETRSNNTVPWCKPRGGEHLDDSMRTLNNPDLWRIKPVPRKVPFGPVDIRCNMWFRHRLWKEDDGFRAIWMDSRHVLINDSQVTYEELQADWTYRLDGESKNLPCEKEVSE